jgi:protein-arginine deiminase
MSMDVLLHLPPNAGEYRQFSLRGVRGQLELSDPGMVDVAVTLRSTGAAVLLRRGKPIAVESIYTDELYVVAKGEAAGLSKSRLRITDAGASTDVVVTTMLATVVIDCDADRDGKVGVNEEGKANWTWGVDGKGGIVLVDNDRDPADSGAGALDEREPLVIRDTGLTSLPKGVTLRLRTAPEGAMKFSVFRKTGEQAKKLLGRSPSEPVQSLMSETADVNLSGETLYIAAHEYPGPFFEGLLLVNLELVHKTPDAERVLASDRVMLRVAPWIMTPNTQAAERVYTCRIDDGPDNKQFLKGLSDAVNAEGLPLEVIPVTKHRGDRWIQDEIEIGYTQSHRGMLPVVFDSPRDRGLDAYPEVDLLGSDFGHFVVGGGVPNSLDSFGNLEVSPPVVVAGRPYPLGRIILGGRRKGDYAHASRQMMAEVRQFLFAQRVQFPFEIFTDWLAVGHVDEIVSFVASDIGPGFKVLLASTRRVKDILDHLADAGHGGALLFEGKHRLDGGSAEVTVDALRTDVSFWSGNATFQEYLDETRTILKAELGVGDGDIVDIPVCFQVKFVSGRLARTLAFFPDMVNHLVHNDLSIVPKPYGPKVDGKCAFETAFEDALPGRRVAFIDDWYSYHEMSGEVHCGTNARRKTFGVSRWWHVRPEGGFDIKTTGFLDER